MTTRTEQTNTPGRHAEHLLSAAREADCDLRESGDGTETLRGRCPFHRTRNPADRTLRVNAKEGFFRCRACNTGGNAGTFTAMIWGVAVTEAHEMLAEMEGMNATTERPRPIALRPRELALETRFRRQNTHLLTVATRHFRRELKRRAIAAQYLRVLGVTPYDGRNAKLGFAGHTGLIEALRRGGCTEEEIEASPLTRRNGDGELEEAFYGSLVIPDLDMIGATKWMAMVPARPDHALNADQAPRPMELPGRRPYLLGASAFAAGAERVAVTDDVRIHAILLTKGIATCYTLGRRDPKRIADKLAAKRPRALDILIRETAMAKEIGNDMRDAIGDRNITKWTTDEIARLIEPSTRDLTRLERREKAAATKPPDT